MYSKELVLVCEQLRQSNALSHASHNVLNSLTHRHLAPRVALSYPERSEQDDFETDDVNNLPRTAEFELVPA
jgi:hypothetical protein